MILFLLASALSICALLLLRAAWRYRQLYRYLMALDVSQLDAPAGKLQVPYLLWGCFAAALNLGIALLN